jgi:hypothetical protein
MNKGGFRDLKKCGFRDHQQCGFRRLQKRGFRDHRQCGFRHLQKRGFRDLQSTPTGSADVLSNIGESGKKNKKNTLIGASSAAPTLTPQHL